MVMPSEAAAIWAEIEGSQDTRALRQFADSFPNTAEAYQARLRADRLEGVGKALANLGVVAKRAVREAKQMANAPRLDSRQRDMAHHQAAEDVRHEAERVRQHFADVLPPGEPERTVGPFLQYFEGKHAARQRARSANRGCHIAVLAIVALIAVLAVGNMFLGG